MTKQRCSVFLLLIFSIVMVVVCGGPVLAAEQESDEKPVESKKSDAKGPKKNVVDGFLSFNGYYDTRDFADMTFWGIVNLPANFQYFTYTYYSNPLNRE